MFSLGHFYWSSRFNVCHGSTLKRELQLVTARPHCAITASRRSKGGHPGTRPGRDYRSLSRRPPSKSARKRRAFSCEAVVCPTTNFANRQRRVKSVRCAAWLSRRHTRFVPRYRSRTSHDGPSLKKTPIAPRHSAKFKTHSTATLNCRLILRREVILSSNLRLKIFGARSRKFPIAFFASAQLPCRCALDSKTHHIAIEKPLIPLAPSRKFRGKKISRNFAQENFFRGSTLSRTVHRSRRCASPAIACGSPRVAQDRSRSVTIASPVSAHSQHPAPRIDDRRVTVAGELRRMSAALIRRDHVSLIFDRRARSNTSQ